MLPLSNLPSPRAPPTPWLKIPLPCRIWSPAWFYTEVFVSTALAAAYNLLSRSNCCPRGRPTRSPPGVPRRRPASRSLRTLCLSWRGLSRDDAQADPNPSQTDSSCTTRSVPACSNLRDLLTGLSHHLTSLPRAGHLSLVRVSVSSRSGTDPASRPQLPSQDAVTGLNCDLVILFLQMPGLQSGSTPGTV